MLMDTQSTPVHTKLWHREFWLVSLANLLLTMSVYMLIPVLPVYLKEVEGMAVMDVGVAMGVYVIGLFALGPFCNYFIQRYRRNKVCMLSALTMVLALCLLTHGREWMGAVASSGVFYVVLRFVLGMAFGLSQMIICSTLIVDVSESNHRTEASYCASWFGRFALSLGPMLAIVLWQGGLSLGLSVFDVAAAIALVAVLLVLLVRFPFKTPEDDIPLVSFDRFFLPSSWLLFLNLMLVTVALGMVLANQSSMYFYAMMMPGFFLALLAAKYVFDGVDARSEAVTAMVLVGVAILLMPLRPQAATYISPVLLGMGLGILGSRFLLYFIQVSLHCQRGTSQSTFFLAWEGGLGLGISLGILYGDADMDAWIALALVAVALVGFFHVTHPWSERHRNR